MGSEFPGSHRRLFMPSDTFTNFHRQIHMSNQEYRVFHLMGYLSLFARPNTRIFHFFFLLCNRETRFGRCPILLSPPSNTKHSVDLPCTHTHVMRCLVHKCNAMPLHVISCHMHNECYMDNTIHTTYRCHGQSHHLHMASINHFIHIQHVII